MNTPSSNIPLYRSQRALLFDWGDTLMRVFPEYPSPMSSWPRVEAMPYALQTLAALHPSYTLCLATNAADSTEADIRSALARVALDPYIDRVYCYRKIGVKKPRPEFFQFILEDLGLPPAQLVMVGDDYEADILGALQAGMHAVWLHPHQSSHPARSRMQVIPDLSFLPSAIRENGIGTNKIGRQGV